MSTPWPMGTQALQVGDLLIDLRFRRIVSAEGSVELQHRIFDLLLLLISEPDRLFTRQELFDRLWAGLVVDDANLSQSIWLLRKALGESRREWIRTVAKRGYVFQPPGPVQWFDSMPPVSDPAQIEAASDPEAAVHAAEANSVTEAVPEADHDADAAPANADGDVGPVAAEAPSAPATPEEPGVAPLVPRRRRHLWVTAAAALLVVVAGLALWTFWPRTDSPVTVALMPLQSNAGADVPWASELLVQWSSWKLQQLPEVQLLNGEDLAQGKALPPPLTWCCSVRCAAPMASMLYCVPAFSGRAATRCWRGRLPWPKRLRRLMRCHGSWSLYSCLGRQIVGRHWKWTAPAPSSMPWLQPPSTGATGAVCSRRQRRSWPVHHVSASCTFSWPSPSPTWARTWRRCDTWSWRARCWRRCPATRLVRWKRASWRWIPGGRATRKQP
ncbi:TPA: winged helix-turn-helix domain-containing protein [Stenotrophomonas maltophilia]|nr:winged helix-turn-helix domain-containing protein [Stenotrophomonas maltophilia]HEL4814374.1 winged helix-turn-helix domain-containing protein [Stenotrophomonas maltophilia]